MDVGADRSLTLVANYVDIPEAQDPLGLTPDGLARRSAAGQPASPRSTTRASPCEQLQGGAIFEQRLGASTLRATAYTGNRQGHCSTWPSRPPRRLNPTHSGGVIDLDGDYHGGDLRWSWAGELAGRAGRNSPSGGNYDVQDQLRRGYENFRPSAPTALGVRGALRRDETDEVSNFDQFAQVVVAVRRSLVGAGRRAPQRR